MKTRRATRFQNSFNEYERAMKSASSRNGIVLEIISSAWIPIKTANLIVPANCAIRQFVGTIV